MKILVLCLAFTMSIFAQEKENSTKLGLGLGYVSAPVYIGSKHRKNYVAPFPYIDYRSKYVNVNRDRIYNDFYDKDNFKIDLSLRGMFPANSSKDSAREGMPDLDLAIEAGPNFMYTLHETPTSMLRFELPVRAVVTFGSDIKYNGVIANTNLRYKTKFFGYNFDYTTGAVFGNKKYHQYYYEVDDKYVTATRASYEAKSGYSGWQNSISMTKLNKRYWYGFFVKHYTLDNAVYEESPLVEKDTALFYGVAFSYIF